MGIYTSPAQLQAAQARRFNLVGKRIEVVHRDLAEKGSEDLKDATSGTLQERDLVAMGHPYAKRPRTYVQLAGSLRKGKAGIGLVQNGRRQVSRRGAVQTLPINKWSGALQSSIFTVRANRTEYDVGAGAKHAKYLFKPGGTKYMKDRPVMGDRTKVGRDGVLRKRFRARVQGYLVAIRNYQRGIF